MLVFVPVTASELAAWAEAGRHRPAAAYAVTPSLCAAFGFAAADDEDAEHTVLHIAGLAGLLSGGIRLVAVAEASGRPVPASEFGEVGVGELPWSAVTALFGDDAPDAAAVLRGRLAGRSVAASWDDEEVAEFLAEHELLWHGPGEWSGLARPVGDGTGDRAPTDADQESDPVSGFVSTFVTASLDLRATGDGGLKRAWESPTPSFLFLIGDVQLGAYIQTDDGLPLNPGQTDRSVVLLFWAPVARELATPGRRFTLVYGHRENEIGEGTIGQPAAPRTL